MPVFSLTRDELKALKPISFAEAGFSERGDLQRLLREQAEAIAPGTLVIAEEFCDWEDSRRRIDLLGVDKTGDLVVIELKRTDDGGHMEIQAVRYAAMVSTMTFDDAVCTFSAYLSKHGDARDARNTLLAHLDWPEPDDNAFASFAQDVKIVLAAADFSRELTSTVLWLNERNLDIRCVRMKPYADGERVLIDIQQVIPLPESADYVVRIRKKEQRERDARRDPSERQTLMQTFWAEFLDRASPRTSLVEGLRPKPKVRLHLNALAAVGGLRFDYFVGIDFMRVGLEINRREEESKRIFEQLHAAKTEIETALDEQLDWSRSDGQDRSRIDYVIKIDGMTVETNRSELTDRLLDAVIRFEAALRPHLDRLKL